MKSLRIALACIGSSVAMSAMATGTYGYDIGHVNPTGTSGTTSFSSTSAANCVMGASGCAQMGGTDYGNSYTWSHASGNVGPSVTISAWGTSTASSTSTIRKAYVGDYTPAGFGITSQSSGTSAATNELTSGGGVNQNGQHAIDNSGGYESLLLSFSTAVTLQSLTIGYHNGGSDASVFEYVGAGDPTVTLGSLAGESYSTLLANGWKFVADVMSMVDGTAKTISQTNATASKYWMVGAYVPNLFGNGAGVVDEFKLSGFSATGAVPEPGSMALFGIAGVALAVSRRRRKA